MSLTRREKTVLFKRLTIALIVIAISVPVTYSCYKLRQADMDRAKRVDDCIKRLENDAIKYLQETGKEMPRKTWDNRYFQCHIKR